MSELRHIERTLAVDGFNQLVATGAVSEVGVLANTVVLFVDTPFERQLFPIQPDQETKVALAYFLMTGDLDGALEMT